MTGRRNDTRPVMSIRFDPDIYAHLRDAAAERGVSATFLVNKAVAAYLDRLLPLDEIRWVRDD